MKPAQINGFVRSKDILFEGQIKKIEGTHLTVMTDAGQFFGMELNEVNTIDRPDYWHNHLDETTVV